MTLEAAPFAPLSDEERTPVAAVKKADEKIPIVPVPDDAPDLNFKIPAKGGSPVKVWAYRDAEGRLLFYDARFEWTENGVVHKDVLPVSFCQVGDARAWRAKAIPAPRPLYGLDRLASRPDAPVVIAEGGKSADAAGELLPGYVAVSWQGGGNAISHVDWTPLKGRHVLIWPDRDRHMALDGKEKPFDEQPGSITAANIINSLRGLASELAVLNLNDWACSDGWDAADALAGGWTSEDAAGFVEKRTVIVDTAAVSILPFRFEYGRGGLYYAESETKRIHVCGRLNVLAKTRDTTGGGWGLLLEWPDDDGARNLWAMPKAMLAGDGVAIREALLERGLHVNPERKARSLLLQFLASVDTQVRARSVAKVGWAGNCFVLPHLTYGDTTSERVIFQHPQAPPHQYRSKGTLAEWKEKVASLAIGNHRMVFAIAAAFVGPILAPSAEEGGGFNYVGTSSSGKTTCMAASVSVWGPPQFMRTWRATSNGLEGVAAQHSETFLAIDELGQLAPQEAGHAAYMLANGQGRQRSTQTGASRTVTAWNIIYLSTGEVGLADLVKQGDRNKTAAAGQEVRILDIPTDAGKGMGAFDKLNGGAKSAEAFSRLIKTSAGQHYGVAAEAFILELVRLKTDVGDLATAAIKFFLVRVYAEGHDGQVLRAARRFGLVAAAGELAIKFGVLPWPQGSVYTAAETMFRDWVGRRGGTGSAEDRNILAQVREFFEANGDTRFDPADPIEVAQGYPVSRPVQNRVGFWKDVSKKNGTGVERQYWVLPEAFRLTLCRGYDQAAVTAVLKKVGALRCNPTDGRASDNRRIKALDGKPTKVYVIGPEIFEGDDELSTGEPA